MRIAFVLSALAVLASLASPALADVTISRVPATMPGSDHRPGMPTESYTPSSYAPYVGDQYGSASEHVGG